MNEQKKPNPIKPSFSNLRKASLVLAAALIFWLAYFVYVKFGVGDVWYWLQEIFLLVFVLFLVILAAAGVVWVMMLIRRKMGNF